MHKISIVGLGNYSIDELPLGLYRFLIKQSLVYARTIHHPIIQELKSEIEIKGFDEVYERHDQFEHVYREIVQRLIELSEDKAIVYAVPGHPRVAETTTQLLLEEAKEDEQLEVQVLGGKSFIDDVFQAVNIDPNDGFSLLDATDLTAAQLNIRNHTVITQVYSDLIASDLKLTLMERYPDDHCVSIVEGAQSKGANVYEVPLYELDFHSSYFTNLTSVFLPKVEEDKAYYSDFTYATEIIDLLVDDEKGCPWDKKQTHDTLKRYLLEESFELFEAIDNEDDWHIIEELGDIMLQVLLHSSIGKKEGYFDIDEVIASLNDKMIRRHPHIFGDAQAQNEEDLKEIWATAKSKEGKKDRVKFEKVFAEHFLKLYDDTKNKVLSEAELKEYLTRGGNDG
ncbi:SAM-dependent methyltransferase [Staphylococcus sp. SQ8-PEA]|uniref:SAM-dependent methyltransferase n=1 Tax=Staphylococcus marylandisciuri TaxID=2981529 RepID=A0ABT2QSR6_9STAP|nr:MazG nucleotide pyrophosphohydrolase domain-containing protein [Staphylococcus marylandisciuri]MCU5747030.1 SAM-dependent methyltransferase [Staphylococcus marylandisciuri]